MEANNIHILGSDTKLIDALRQINILAPEPLVLFVVDEDNRMVGTLTDGDSRRALIATRPNFPTCRRIIAMT